MEEGTRLSLPESPPAALRCRSCDAASRADDRFCGQCGLDLNAPAVAAVPAVDPATMRKVCRGCRTVNEASFSYCFHCGLPLPAEAVPFERAFGDPGGVWLRLGAFALDAGIFFGLLVAALLGVAITLDMQAPDRLALIVETWQGQALPPALAVAYWTLFLGARGWTPGKWVLGLRVVRTNGARLTYARAFARSAAYLMSALPLGLGFLAIGLSPQKRAWHDLLCDTHVLRVRR